MSLYRLSVLLDSVSPKTSRIRMEGGRSHTSLAFGTTSETFARGPVFTTLPLNSLFPSWPFSLSKGIESQSSSSSLDMQIVTGSVKGEREIGRQEKV